MATRWNKRKRDDWDNEDSGDERMGTQVLPVARNLPSSGVPRDGAEYLLSVRMAAGKLPSFTKVVNPYFKLELNHTHTPPERPTSGKYSALPCDEWKTRFAKRLLELRKNMCQIELDESSVEAVKSLRLPGPKDRPGWQHFIFGEPPEPSPAVDEDDIDEFEVLNTQPTPDLDVDDASSSDGESEPSKLMEKDDKPVSHNAADGSSAATNTHNDPLPEPSLALLRGLNQHTVAQLLLFYEYWLRESLAGNPSIFVYPKGPDGPADPCIAISQHHSKWLFGLIARYDNDVMDGKEVSALRSLARVCITTICRSLRSELLKTSGSDPSAPNTDAVDPAVRDSITGRTSLWMVVAAVASVWGQSDIWEEANAKLHSLDLPLAGADDAAEDGVGT